jgi:hypothetical protein
MGCYYHEMVCLFVKQRFCCLVFSANMQMLLSSFFCKCIDMDVISNQQDPHLKSDTDG